VHLRPNRPKLAPCSPSPPTFKQAFLTAREILKSNGHDLISICDLRSEPSKDGKSSQWRWRFLAASCPLVVAAAAVDDDGAAAGDEGAGEAQEGQPVVPYLFTGGPFASDVKAEKQEGRAAEGEE